MHRAVSMPCFLAMISISSALPIFKEKEQESFGKPDAMLSVEGVPHVILRLQTLKLVLSKLPYGDSILCGFISSLKKDNEHLLTLQAIARQKNVKVAATLSLEAARHYQVKIPSYALFTNHSNGLRTKVLEQSEVYDIDRFLSDCFHPSSFETFEVLSHKEQL